MATLEKAIEIAAAAHSGQLDKGGSPYILHPLKVMFRVSSEEERITAVLHDVIEDTEVSLTDLEDEGFSPSILEALDALTKRNNESRMDAAKRAAKNPLALSVKLADNAENRDISRLKNPDDKDFQRLEEYRKVRNYLISIKSSQHC